MQAFVFSVIIPVYNRPDELYELLLSLQQQDQKDFEVIVVEDGSTTRCEGVVDQFRDSFAIQYFYKPNSGPGPTRNYGFSNARGKYLVVFDSDCILPPHYFSAVMASLSEHHWDAWGGPDRGHENFTPVQQAMGYTMSSVLTTGGIRGGKKIVGQFQPRSFNMGLSREVYEKTGGFAFARFAEDIELSYRMIQEGFKVGLVQEAFVYHKRRTTFSQFYKQVYNFGRGRVMVGRVHRGAVKLTHWFPTFFLIAVAGLILLPLFNLVLFFIGLLGLAGYFSAIAVLAYRSTRQIQVALLSVPAAFLQLTGYGLGFLTEKLKIIH